MPKLRFSDRYFPLVALTIVAFFLLSSVAGADERQRTGIFTVAVVDDAVYVGHATPLGDSGNFELHGLVETDGECSGYYRYHAFPSGRARFKCTNGLAGSVRIKADGTLAGSGRGSLDGKQIRLVFGYSLHRTNRLLKFPGDRELRLDDKKIVLVDSE